MERQLNMDREIRLPLRLCQCDHVRLIDFSQFFIELSYIEDIN